MPRSERIATYIFYFKRTSGHKYIISWSPPFHLHCCPIAVSLFRQTLQFSSTRKSTNFWLQGNESFSWSHFLVEAFSKICRRKLKTYAHCLSSWNRQKLVSWTENFLYCAFDRQKMEKNLDLRGKGCQFYKQGPMEICM